MQSSLDLFCEVMGREDSLLVEGLWDAPKAILCEKLLHNLQKSVLVITAEKSGRLADDLTYFKCPILEFPSWETLPGDAIAPSADIVGKRFEILHKLKSTKEPHLILCPLQAILQKLLPPQHLSSLCMLWKTGDKLPFNQLEQKLVQLGYRRVPVVSDKGEFALRGGILDIFPLAAQDPFRLDFFGDQIDSIRRFDPIGQKSIAKADAVFLSPADELSLLRAEKNLTSFLDYLPKNTTVVFDDLLLLEDKATALASYASPFFFSFDELFQKAKTFQNLYFSEHAVEELSDVKVTKKVGRAFYSGKNPLQPLQFTILDQEIATKRWAHPFHDICDFFSVSDNMAASTPEEIVHGIHRFAKSNLELHVICASNSEENYFHDLIKKEQVLLPKATHFDTGYLSSGCVITDAQIALLPIPELTHRYKVRRQKWRSTYHTPPSDFHELSVGDVVVHFHNGIGKYLGVEKRTNHLGALTEFMAIEYAAESKLYVPLSQSYLVTKYIGAHETLPTLSTLGTSRWQKTKLQAQKAIIGYAQDLLNLNAERAISGGFVYPQDSSEMASFESDFPFVETEDQLQAISAIKQDMMSSKAMDRLICGDVGYGKTEVAMRAAFKAVADGKKQVAVLVPTTILAMQHFETFKNRMANYPINIGVISRFQSAKENKKMVERAASGSVDILIGTHRLISKDVHFAHLGLIIIDEEQRFGVRAKEHLKKLKAGVDCLTLSATPIPRTLYLSLVGAREISVINTPPQDRLPIKTLIAEKDPAIVTQALLRELAREGQIFFIHNRVETIFQVKEELHKLVPQARIVVGHGQMSSEEIDSVFSSFKSGEADILVSTTIVENGIDIPNANTILIDRADTFGLADLYQMRGRVGRWNRPAYAYFLTPLHRSLPEQTRKRLQALAEASGYGGGMRIAMRDLELRGAGDILGTQQSGQISSIGFHLYCKLLKRTIDALQKKIPPSFTETKMEFGFEAYLPEEYIDEITLRMEIYHRLGEATQTEEADAILAELKDRFGPPPPPVFWLIHLTRLRIFASRHQFTLLKFEKFTFTAEQQTSKGPVRKVLQLPQAKSPSELEKQIIASLQKSFIS